MDSILLNDKNLVGIQAGLMLVFCGIPVQMIVTFYEGENYMTIVQLCFGYVCNIYKELELLPPGAPNI